MKKDGMLEIKVNFEDEPIAKLKTDNLNKVKELFDDIKKKLR